MDYFGVALSLAEKVVDKIPDYDDRKRAKLTKAKKLYNREIKREKDERDHDLILYLREDLEPLLEEIKGL